MRNTKAFLIFHILYTVFSQAALPPVMRWLFLLALRLAGFRYLTAENVFHLLRNPFSLPLLAAVCLIFAFVQMIQLSGIIYLYDCSRQDRTVSLGRVMQFALKGALRTLKPANAVLLLLLLFMTPVLHFATAINYLGSFTVLHRILIGFLKNRAMAAVLVLLALGYLALMVRWIFVYHYGMLEENEGLSSIRRSRELGEGAKKQIFIMLFTAQILLTLAFVAVLLAVIGIASFAGKRFDMAPAVVSSAEVTFQSLARNLLDSAIIPVNFYMISRLYYARKEELCEPILRRMEPSREEYARFRHLLPWVETILLSGSILLSVLYYSGLSRGLYILRVQHLQTMQVTAHRGASRFYPENTMAAFKGAVEQGADWIELDVNESADGRIYVMHDSNFRRTAGVNANSWEKDWKDICGMDAGSWFSEEYAGEKVPLLEEAVDFAKENGIRLNIELKPTGHEKHLVEKVVDIILEADYAESCVITSQAYRTIENVKQYNEDIFTVYVTGFAYGAISRLKSADAFSIRSDNITPALVSDLHNKGIEVYAWTVNSRVNINRMIRMGVDNIITDNVPLAIECINDSRTDNILGQLVCAFREAI